MAPEEKQRQKLIRECTDRLSKAEAALRQKTKELDRRIRDEQPKLFPESNGLFEKDVGFSPSQREAILAPYRVQVKKLADELSKLQKSLDITTGKLF